MIVGTRSFFLKQEDSAVKASSRLRIYRGVRRITGLLKRATREGPGKFNYNATFPGLTPYEAVYIPHGLFVPLSAIPGKRNRVANAIFEGIAPLSVLALSPGIFVPHRASSLPPLPSLFPKPPTGGGKPGENADEDEEYGTNSTMKTPVWVLVMRFTFFPCVIQQSFHGETLHFTDNFSLSCVSTMNYPASVFAAVGNFW